MEDSGAWRTAPGSQHRLRPHPYQVMRRQSDEKVAVEIVEESKKRFPELADVSWDKGAHSPQNQRELKATKGFERYVALAVLAKNIHRLGTVLREQQKERQRRKRGPYKKAAPGAIIGSGV